MSPGMKLATKIRKKLDIPSIYGFWKKLHDNGAKITRNGVEKLEMTGKGGAYQTLAVLRQISQMSWEEFGREFDAEFLPKKK